MPDKEAEYLPQGEDNVEHELNTYQARQAVMLGRTRYVLAIALVLVVIMFAIIYLAGP